MDLDGLVAAIEVQTAVLVRNLEMLQRRSDFYVEVDRAGYLILRVLESTGPLDIGALSARLGLDPSTVGRQIGAVRAAGMVDKSPDPRDQRRMVVAATEAGRQAMRAVRDRRRRGTAEILHDWSAEDLQTLADMFTRYNETVARRYLRGDVHRHAGGEETAGRDETGDPSVQAIRYEASGR